MTLLVQVDEADLSRIVVHTRAYADFYVAVLQQSVQVKSKLAEIEDLQSRELHRQERIEKAHQDLQAAERDFSSLAPYEPPRAEIVCFCNVHLIFLYMGSFVLSLK